MFRKPLPEWVWYAAMTGLLFLAVAVMVLMMSLVGPLPSGANSVPYIRWW